MSAQNPPKKGVAFEFYVAVASRANADIFQVSPTMAAGDVKVSIDNGTSNNITTLPVIGTNTRLLKCNLSATEMNGDNISVVFSDAAGSEWCDLMVNIQTTGALAESYRANGAAPTMDQAIFEILAHLGESSISGTTKTIKKIDHATTAETFTLDSATAPTSVTRAT